MSDRVVLIIFLNSVQLTKWESPTPSSLPELLRFIFFFCCQQVNGVFLVASIQCTVFCRFTNGGDVISTAGDVERASEHAWTLLQRAWLLGTINFSPLRASVWAARILFCWLARSEKKLILRFSSYLLNSPNSLNYLSPMVYNGILNSKPLKLPLLWFKVALKLILRFLVTKSN